MPHSSAWIVQELISLATFLFTVIYKRAASRGIRQDRLSNSQLILIAMYSLHYIQRAIVAPLLTKRISPSVYYVFLAAVIFNLCNGYLMAAHILQQTVAGSAFISGFLVFALGMLGNIYHDEIIRRLQRKKSGYTVPHGGLFRYISFPNYLCEWFEWLGFALAATQGPGYTAPWIFLILEIAVMMPRAYNGHRWYQRKFGRRMPRHRRAVLPGIF